jgi:hypothetical protein
MHRKSHIEIAKATGNEIPETTKVRRLIKSLQVDTMVVPFASIRAQDNLRGDFDATVNYLRTIVTSTKNESRNVAEFTKKSGKNNFKKSSNKSKFKKGNNDK